VGCGGSGKSYLSLRLGALLGLPVTHLDDLYYDLDWNTLPAAEFAAVQEELVAGSAWVIDGNYNSTLSIRLRACDTVVLMDVSTLAALWGIVSRYLRHGGGHRGGGVHNRITWGFVVYVATYRRRMRPRVLAAIAEHARHAEVVRLTGRRHTERWLATIPRS